MTLTKEQILSSSDRKIEKVDIPEWGGHVYVRSLTVREEVERENALADINDVDRITCISVAFWLCDESGAQILTVSDAEALLQKSSLVIARIFASGRSLNRYLINDAVEQARGNS